MTTTQNVYQSKEKDIIPIFYACDDAFVKYTIVSLKSMIENASIDRNYKIHILYAEISDEMMDKLLELQNCSFEIVFVNVKAELEKIGKILPLRHYYSKTTYYRLFIAELFPEYKKAIYIDSDTVILGDISKLYDTDIKDNYVGACHEQAMVQHPDFGLYAEKVVGVDRNKYFNAGMILINCEQFRKNKLFENFLELLGVYNFIVTQDEDYLNVLCKDKVFWLHDGWNTEVFGKIPVKESEIRIIHYIMVSKPWHYKECRLKEHFWKYAKQTSVYALILEELENFSDEKKLRDAESAIALENMAKTEIAKPDNYFNIVNAKKLG